MKHVLEFFEGHIIDISKDAFWVRITDNEGDFEGEVKISVVSLEEQKYIILGAFFTWIFYNDDSYDFIFYKETWTKEQIEQIERNAEELKIKPLYGDLNGFNTYE